MPDGPPPTKRKRYDLTLSFDVRVGQQSFPVYHDIITRRSGHLRALRVEQMTNSPDLPITLDGDPEIFSAFLHTVYFGVEHLKDVVTAMLEDDAQMEPSTNDNEHATFEDERVEKFLIDLYLLANRLIDPITANLAIDELIVVIEKRNRYLYPELIRFTYESTTAASPLRRLIRDFSIVNDIALATNVEFLRHAELPSDYVKDILWEVLAINRRNADAVVRDIYCEKVLRPELYHQAIPDSDDQVVDENRASASAEESPEESSSEEESSEEPALAEGPPPRKRIHPANSGPLAQPSGEGPPRKRRKRTRPDNSGPLAQPSGERPPPRKRGRPANSGTVVFKRPQQANKWWSVSQAKFDGASANQKYRYTAVANAMESGTVKTPACANCVRRAANGLEDLADCKAVAGGRCGRCLWAAVPAKDGCP